jgi:Tfp pilus assembly protein PilF/4-amino-4-deoxy-L-arabinose transferase-like glycosyltransferase
MEPGMAHAPPHDRLHDRKLDVTAPTGAATALAWAPIWLLALAVRLAHVWAIRGTPLFDHLIGDGRAYDAWAQRIAGGNWLGSGVFYQAPLYPYLLAGIYVVIGHDLRVVRLIQATLGATACVLLGIAGHRFFSERVGRVAALGLALWPSAFFADALIQKSALDTVLLCGLLAALAAALERTDGRGWGIIGVTLGALALTRENTLVFIPIVLVALVRHGRGALHARMRPAAAFVLGLTLVLLPVALRNRWVSGEWHLTTAQFGPNFYIGNNPAATGLYQPLRPGRGDPEFEQRDATEMAEQATGRALTPGEVSRYWMRRAGAFIAEQPGAWVALLARKAALLVNRVEVGDAEDQYTYADWSPGLALLGPLLNFGVLVPLAAAGVLLCWPRRQRLAVLLALLGVYALTVICTYVMARYRYPMLPLLLLFATAGAVEAGRAARARQWRRLAAAAGLALCSAVPANWPLISTARVRAATLYNIGRSTQDDGDGRARAIAYYRQALALAPDFALAQNNLGTALQRSGHLPEAVDHLRRAVELQPQQVDYHYNLAGALAQLGDTDGAAAAYGRALALDPTDADVHNNFGVLLQGRGALAEAIAQFKAALAVNPRHVGALNNLGVTYAQQGDLNSAIHAFDAALAIDPTDAAARDNRARAQAAAAPAAGGASR